MIPTSTPAADPRHHLLAPVLPPELTSRIRALAWEIAVLVDGQAAERKATNG